MAMDRTDAENCRGKISYPTKAAANRAARLSQKRRGGPVMEHFFCPHCQGFHIGRQNGALRVKAKMRRIERSWGVHGEGVRL